MSSRRTPLGENKTNPSPTEVDEASEDANTTVIDPPSESVPTAPIPAPIAHAPSPRLKTAPYVIFDAVSAKEAAAKEEAKREAEASDKPALEHRGPMTIPGPGPKAPGASPTSHREILPVRGPEPITMKTNDDGEPPRRVVSMTGAFVGGILAIAVVAGAGVVGGMMMNRPQNTPISSSGGGPRATQAEAPTMSGATTMVATTTTSTTPSTSETSASNAPTASATTTPSATTTQATSAASSTSDIALPKESGNKPSKTSLERLTTTLKPELTACVKGQPKAMYSVKITYDGATGKPTDAQIFVPIRGTVAGGCVLRASFDSRINPFAGASFTAELKFSP